MELLEERVGSNRVEAKLRLKTVGRHGIHCNYTVVLMPKSVDSGNSITHNVTVTGGPGRFKQLLQVLDPDV